MTTSSPLRLRVLLALHLLGSADSSRVASSLDETPGDVDREVDAIVDADLAVAGRGGVSLSPEGRFLLRHLLRDELDQPGVRAGIESAYRRFLGLNGRLLDVCTAWQLRPSPDGSLQPNPHDDASYDDSVIERLSTLHDDMGPVLGQLAETLDRFARYRDRLGIALERLVAGEHDYFTRPMFPSYHSTWFELHEDLLITLDTTRRQERSQSE